MAMVKVYLTLIWCFLQKYSVESYAAKQYCKTPTNEDSTCIKFGECVTMVAFFQILPKSIPEPVTNALQDFVCPGSEGGPNALICCPSGKFNIDNNGNIYGPPPPPPNIHNHKNLKYLPTECGEIGIFDRIRGGDDAELLEFPWMALLIYNKGDELVARCGGTIINEKYILTAAHCVVENSIPFAGVRVGEYSLLSDRDCGKIDGEKRCIPPVQHLLVERIIVHKEYEKRSKVNDIALLRVTKINMEPENIQPICLPLKKKVLKKPFRTGVVTGWGLTDPNGENVVDVLQKLPVEKRDLSVCVDAYKHLPHIKMTPNSYKRLCLGGEKGKDSCQGDSGGPFHVGADIDGEQRYVQRGIVSLGHIECGTEGFPAIYTNVDYYTDWILDNIEA